MALRIAHITTLISGKADGIFGTLDVLFRKMDGTKYEQILVYQGNDEVEEACNSLGVRTITQKDFQRKFCPALFFKLYSLLKLENIDVIHCHSLKSYVYAGFANIFLRKKLIFNYHGLFIKSEYYNVFEAMLYRIMHLIITLFGAVDLALCPSEASRIKLLKETIRFPKMLSYYLGAEPNTDVTPYNTDIAAQLALLKEKKRLIAFVGRLDQEKRPDLAVQTLKRLIANNCNVHLLFFGDGTLSESIKALAEKEALTEHITFLGFIPKAHTYFSHVDILLLTSDREGFPLSIWEAMAAGVPIVSSDVGGIPEVIIHAECGLLFHPGDYLTAADNIQHILTNKNLHTTFSQNARDAIRKHFSHKNYIEFMEKVYESLG